MNVLHPFVKVVLIVLTTLSGSTGTTTEHARKVPIASDPAGPGSKAKPLFRRSAIGGASCVSMLECPEMTDAPEPPTGILPEGLESAPTRLGPASLPDTAFGAGSYALNALGYGAPAERGRY